MLLPVSGPYDPDHNGLINTPSHLSFMLHTGHRSCCRGACCGASEVPEGIIDHVVEAGHRLCLVAGAPELVQAAAILAPDLFGPEHPALRPRVTRDQASIKDYPQRVQQAAPDEILWRTGCKAEVQNPESSTNGTSNQAVPGGRLLHDVFQVVTDDVGLLQEEAHVGAQVLSQVPLLPLAGHEELQSTRILSLAGSLRLRC